MLKSFSYFQKQCLVRMPEPRLDELHESEPDADVIVSLNVVPKWMFVG